jgi:medium-chain acyl-[acyl-carrier-protein] hydrolase
MLGASDRRNPTTCFNGQKAKPRATARLFCLPYAGGGAPIYRGWEQSLPAGVDVWPVQLPGRGSRYREKPYASFEALVSDVAEAMRPFIDLPFCLFGHSLGALVSFELAHRLREEYDAEPRHLFVSGCRGPQFPRGGPTNIHHLPDDEFIKKLRELNGTPREVLENPDLIQVMMETLRADFRLAETYRCAAETKLSCPVTALGGSEDEAVPQDELEGWREQTTGPFDFWMLPGDHFFLHTSEPMVLSILTQQLKRMLP